MKDFAQDAEVQSALPRAGAAADARRRCPLDGQRVICFPSIQRFNINIEEHAADLTMIGDLSPLSDIGKRVRNLFNGEQYKRPL